MEETSAEVLGAESFHCTNDIMLVPLKNESERWPRNPQTNIFHSTPSPVHGKAMQLWGGFYGIGRRGANIGCGSGCDIQFPSPGLLEEHASIRCEGTSYSLSANGEVLISLHVDGLRPEMELLAGDEFLINGRRFAIVSIDWSLDNKKTRDERTPRKKRVVFAETIEEHVFQQSVGSRLFLGRKQKSISPKATTLEPAAENELQDSEGGFDDENVDSTGNNDEANGSNELLLHKASARSPGIDGYPKSRRNVALRPAAKLLSDPHLEVKVTIGIRDVDRGVEKSHVIIGGGRKRITFGTASRCDVILDDDPIVGDEKERGDNGSVFAFLDVWDAKLMLLDAALSSQRTSHKAQNSAGGNETIEGLPLTGTHIFVARRPFFVGVGDVFFLGNRWVQLGDLRCDARVDEIAFGIQPSFVRLHSDPFVKERAPPVHVRCGPVGVTGGSTAVIGKFIQMPPKDRDLVCRDFKMASHNTELQWDRADGSYLLYNLNKSATHRTMTLVGRQDNTGAGPVRLLPGMLFQVGRTRFRVMKVVVRSDVEAQDSDADLNSHEEITPDTRGVKKPVSRRVSHAAVQFQAGALPHQGTVPSTSSDCANSDALENGRTTAAAEVVVGASLPLSEPELKVPTLKSKRRKVEADEDGLNRKGVVRLLSSSGRRSRKQRVAPTAESTNDGTAPGQKEPHKNDPTMINCVHSDDPEVRVEAVKELWDPAVAANHRIHTTQSVMEVKYDKVVAEDASDAEQHFIVLKVIRGPGRNRILRLKGDCVTVGSRVDNTITIKDRSLSAHHATIFFSEGMYYLLDRRSASGTWLVSTVDDPEYLRAGSVFVAGQTEFTVHARFTNRSKFQDAIDCCVVFCTLS